MNRQVELNGILKVIKETYGSLEEPKYFFTRKVMKQRPYEEVISEVRRHFSLEEWTVPDDDVSFVYYIDQDPPAGALPETHFLTLPSARWLKLSMLGPYAMFLRFYPGSPERAKVLTAKARDLTSAERGVVELLERHDVALLDKELLYHPVPIQMFNVNADEARLYNALFSDDYLLDKVELE